MRGFPWHRMKSLMGELDERSEDNSPLVFDSLVELDCDGWGGWRRNLLGKSFKELGHFFRLGPKLNFDWISFQPFFPSFFPLDFSPFLFLCFL